MPNSGVSSVNVGRNYQLRLEWSASQDVNNNRSTVTARLYWLDRTGYGYVSSSATKTCAMRQNGSSWNTRSAAGMASLSTNQKKQIQSWTFTVNHSSTGSANLTMGAYFDVESTLEGSYVGRINLSNSTWSLPDIPRASSLSSNSDWTAGSNKTFSISRASNSFSHDLVIQVKDSGGTWRGIKTMSYSTSQSSLSSSFSTGENTNIFRQISGRSSADTRLILKTYSGNSLVGEKYYYGTVTAPSATTVNTMNGKANYEHDFWIGDNVGANLSVSNSGFTHTVRISTSGSFSRTWTGVGSSFSWTPSAAEQQSIYSDAANLMRLPTTFSITTYYNGEQVRSTVNKNMWFYVRNSEPTFGTGFTYLDVNSATAALTGNNKYLVQGKSTVRVDIPESAKAAPVNGATMKYYDITLDGDTIRVDFKATGTVSATFTNFTAAANTSLAIKAVDSRDNATTRSISVNVVPYTNPTVNFTAPRINNFETDTQIKVNGKLSPLNVAGTNKNALVSARYRYREKGVGSYTTFANFSVSGFPAYTVTTIVLPLDNQKAWEVEVEITDKLGSRSVIKVVDVGKPILFIDPGLKSLGFGDYPTAQNEFKINGRIVFGNTMWSSHGQGEGQGAMYLNNSDITGLNGLYFADIANNRGEGLLWPKTGVTPDPQNPDLYDTFRVLDGVGYLNNKPIFSSDDEVLWNGALFMDDRHTIKPSKSLAQCPTGWILLWSGYDGSTSRNYDWNYAFVHKRYPTITSGGFWANLIGLNGNWTKKYLYATNTELSGHSSNNNSGTYTNSQVLRYVFPF